MEDTMSDNEEKNDIDQAVTVTPDDIRAALEFWTHFEIPKIPELDQALALFEAEQSYKNQKAVLLALTKAVAFTDHPAFQDEIFQKIIPACKEKFADVAFDQEIEQLLSSTDQK